MSSVWRKRSIPKFGKHAVLTVVSISAVGVVAAIMLHPSHVSVVPDPPTSATIPLELPATASHLSLAVTCPKTAITALLENAIPNTFQFDVNSGGARAYGSPSREPLNVAFDAAAGRVSISTRVSGKVQVEKRVKIDLLVTKINELASVGINISGSIGATLSPAIAPSWKINPQLALSAHVDRAVASIPVIGGIDVTGHVQGPVANAVNGVKATAEVKLEQALDVRKEVERIWNEINMVHPLTDNPPTWLRITPRQATFGKFHYTNDAIDSGLALDLEMRVFVQDKAPEL